MASRYRSVSTKHKAGPWAVLLALSVGACGQMGELKPPPGQPLPVRPLMASSTPTPEELLTPPAIARPVRSDEIIRRSAPRRPDRFDLPPSSGAPAAPEPEPERDAATVNEQTRVQEPL